MFLFLLFLHIAAMFGGVAASYGPTAMFVVAIRSNRIERVRAVGIAVAPLTRMIPILFAIGAIFGVAAAVVAGHDLLAPWLVISYVLFVIATLIGALYTNRVAGKVTAAMGDATSGPLPPAAAELVRTRVFAGIQALDFATIVGVTFVMVIKPFS